MDPDAERELWKKLCDPTKKIYDPFGEYHGHDNESVTKPKAATDPITRFVREYGYYSHGKTIEKYDPLQEEWKLYDRQKTPPQSSEQHCSESLPEPEKKQRLFPS